MTRRQILLNLASVAAWAQQPSNTPKPNSAMSNRFVFQGGSTGLWKVTRQSAYRGENLPTADRLEIIQGEAPQRQAAAQWALTGFTSNVRYATTAEVARLRAVQPTLGRPEATCGALIPIKKSAAWWALAQDERRAIFEETSHHTAIGMDYLPAIARRLHHSRDLNEPFDFLTWFEFAPKDKPAFDDLVVKLRGTKEWTYVEREVDIRVERLA